jgi:hypothetical protein
MMVLFVNIRKNKSQIYKVWLESNGQGEVSSKWFRLKKCHLIIFFDIGIADHKALSQSFIHWQNAAENSSLVMVMTTPSQLEQHQANRVGGG